jgi:NADPH:quinone reductase
MKAIRVHEQGDVSKLQLEQIPTPNPGPGEARVKLSHAGLNFIDVYQRNGTYTIPLPSTLGMEGAGEIDALGPRDGVANLEIGLSLGVRVAFAMHLGSYAEYAIIPTSELIPIPDGVSNNLAAAVMLQGATAHYLAKSTFKLSPGHTCLVHAAAGGVGLLLVQIAKKCGARVIGTVSSDEKAALAKAAGADEIILYTETDFELEVLRLTDGHKLDVIYDSVGQTTFLKGLNVLKPRGMMVLYGASSGPVEPFSPQLLNQKGSLFVTRPTLAHHMLTREELLWRIGDLFTWIANGELDVRIDQTFKLEEIAQAHEYIESRASKGKILLEVS